MSDYIAQINQEIKEAMKSQDKARLRGVRAIKADLLNAQTDGSGRPIDEERYIAILKKLVKQRKESYDIYTEQNRPDLAQTEKEEWEVIEAFLPKMMSSEEVDALVKRVVEETGAQSMKDMGTVMAKAISEAAGKADGKELSNAVRKALQ